MSAPRQKWLPGLQSTPLYRPPPESASRKQNEILAYVELFGQSASDSFVDDIGELVRGHYPSNEHCLLDDVLATFVLHHPEHGHAILHALLSCVIDGTVIYNKQTPPFGSFVSLFSPSTEREFSEQWAHACAEILRVLTHYNRPTFKSDNGQPSGSNHSPSTSGDGPGKGYQGGPGWEKQERSPTRLLTPWITDSLLAAPPSIRSDYFQWCGGVMGEYAAGEELRPPTTVGGQSQGKQPQLLPSTPRWAVANGAAVILSVCDDEVARHETADLTAAAVPALLIPPPTAPNEHLMVSGLPLLEPYAHLFHRYYAVATPGATQRLLFGLLEAPPTWSPDALVVAVGLVELLRAADDYNSAVQLPPDWLNIHFLRPVGAALAKRSGTAADAAAALLFHIFSQPVLLFSPPSQFKGVFATRSLYGSVSLPANTEEAKAAAAQANEEATAKGLAALMVEHGPDVERRICALWESAYGLRPLSSTVGLPELLLSTPLQPPVLSWNVLRALFRIIEYLPPDGPSQACLRRIFSATVQGILRGTFPYGEVQQQKDGIVESSQSRAGGIGAKSVGMAELRAMVHCLFTETFLSPKLAAQLLSSALSLCLSHDAIWLNKSRPLLEDGMIGSLSFMEDGRHGDKYLCRPLCEGVNKRRGAVATFDSYVIAAVCALACEVQLLPFSPAYFTIPKPVSAEMAKVEIEGPIVGNGGPQDPQRSSSVLASCFPFGVTSVVEHTKRLLGILELLLVVSPGPSGTQNADSSTTNEILGNAVVAAHMSDLLGHSRACLHSLTGIMRCKWDPGTCVKASAVLSAIERNGDLVSLATRGNNGYGSTDHAMAGNMTKRSKLFSRDSDQVGKPSSENLLNHSTSQKPTNCKSEGTPEVNDEGCRTSNGHVEDHVTEFPLEATDVASLLCKERHNGLNGNESLKCVLIAKQHLAVGAAALLFQRLVVAPEIPWGSEQSSMECGWVQVVDALCSLSAIFPFKVGRFIVSQAETELQPWTVKDSGQCQQSVWSVNSRIVGLLSELLRMNHIPDIVKVVVQDDGLLKRATDGMTLDGETCKLPQLELLEAAALAAQMALKWDEPDEEIADKLFALLRERLPATVRCLSHHSTHVRAMSVARLRDMLFMESLRSNSSNKVSESEEREDQNGINWRRYVEQCVVWEVHCRRAGGMSISLLANAANSLGCPIPIQLTGKLNEWQIE